MNVTIHTGKFSREVQFEIVIARECTRWHVYPGRPLRYLAALINGVWYQRARSGIWFRSVVGPGGYSDAPSKLVHRISPSARIQLQELAA